MPGLAPTGFRFDTPPDHAVGRDPPLEVIVHEAPAGALAAREAQILPGAQVLVLRARVVRLQADGQRAREQLAVMRSHALRARHIEERAPYRYDRITVCASTFLGSGAGAIAGGVCGLLLGAPVWVIGVGAIGAGVVSVAVVAGRKLHAQCAREFHASRAGTEADRDQVERHTQQLTRQVREARKNLAAAERLAQVDAAIRSPVLPVDLLKIIAEYDLPDPDVPAALAPSAPA